MSLDVGGLPIRRLLVLGFGVTGRAVVEFCLRRGLPPSVSEARRLTGDERAWLTDHGIAFEEDGHTERLLSNADVVVLSPGVPADHPVPSAARDAGILVLSELDFASSQAFGVPIVAVTGTNGKGTTVTLIDAILRRTGWRTRLGGNIGTPFISLVEGIEDCDAVVLEASSFQLEQSELLRPRVGALLNLTPDHLDRHGTMAAYAEAKGRLFRLQDHEDVAVVPSGLRDVFRQGKGRRISFDAPPPALPVGIEPLSPHNRENLAAAISCVAALDPTFDGRALVIDSLQDAFSLPHRMQEIGAVNRVRVINDSKSTNANSTVAALRAIDARTTLLLGGRHKGAGYTALAREIRSRDVRRVVVFGEAASFFEDLFENEGITAMRAASMEEAVALGLAGARWGDVLLFSPACSSFDAFRNYAERGNAFVRGVRACSGFVERTGKDA
jgi:UDP-N-acetylmuramoylalanine--D-glutamate ligase